MQALAREARLKVRLQELVSTLEQVTKNAEARLLEGREIVHDLNQTNRYVRRVNEFYLFLWQYAKSFYIFSVLAETVDRNNKRYQAKFKKMEQQMLSLVEKHTTQVNSKSRKMLNGLYFFEIFEDSKTKASHFKFVYIEFAFGNISDYY